MDAGKSWDKHKDNGILLEKAGGLECRNEGVMGLAETRSELLNNVYREISEKLGMDTAMEIYRMFKGQQISFAAFCLNMTRDVLLKN